MDGVQIDNDSEAMVRTEKQIMDIGSEKQVSKIGFNN